MILELSVDNIHNVDAKLRQEEDAVTVAEEGAAVGTVILLEPGIADGDTSLGLNAPSAGEDPGVSIFATEGDEVTLQAAVLDGRIEAERNLGVTHVIVAVNEVSLIITFVEKRIAIFTHA